MTWLLGSVLGLGIVLAISPWLWPRTARSDEPRPRARLLDRLTQAGLVGLPPLALAAISLVVGVLAAGIALAFAPVVAVAAAVFVAGAAAPLLAVRWRAKRRRRAQAAVWPDVVDHLVSAVRSGLALPDAVAQLERAGPEITRPAFAAYAADHRATGSFGYALDRLKDRLADPVGDRIVETLRMAREVGGTEVTTVLRELAAYLRVDLATRGELEARQTWIVSAARLGVAAPWIVLLILSTRPEAAQAYNSAGGFMLIACGALVTFIAYRVMLRIGALPTEARWFA
ncbi:type II secretion system F family protein [Agrococcus sp. ARC_14]|uniref:type II secretion system F family protein n=1 Tax=Agrococcus sp. ARC_14 TaxID=2919927 RepID=UPI001F0664DD|nr:type II secretion system F family protein [Agrococcus sp. ARC_14]MCH1882672.1 type II secretion system F family protein [Agrococcus sp. ARC_14]